MVAEGASWQIKHGINATPSDVTYSEIHACVDIINIEIDTVQNIKINV